MAEREFPLEWTKDCGMTYDAWYQEWLKRMAEQSGLSMDERIKLSPNEMVNEAGKEAAAQLRRKAAMGIATPVALAALGIGVSAIATGGIALVPAVIGAVAGGAIGGATTWRTVVGAFGLRGTDPTVLSYRMQKVMKNIDQTTDLYKHRLEDIKNAMAQLDPNSSQYKNYEKQYTKLMQNFDKDLKHLERKAGKLNLLANKGKFAYLAHNGPADENSIFGKGVVGKVNSARGRVGGVLDRYTNHYFSRKNYDVTKMYQGAANIGSSIMNYTDQIRKDFKLPDSEVTKEAREAAGHVDETSSYNLQSKINQQTYNKDGIIPTIGQTKAGETRNYGQEATEDLKATHIINGYKELENKGQTFNLVEEYNKISKDNNLTEEQKNEVRKYILSSRNAVVDTKNITNKTNNFYKILVNDVMLKSSISDVMKNKDNWEMMGNLAELFGRADVQQGLNDYILKNNLDKKVNDQQLLQIGDWMKTINEGATELQKAKEKVAKKTEAATKKETQQGWSDYLTERAQESSSSTSNQTQRQA